MKDSRDTRLKVRCGWSLAHGGHVTMKDSRDTRLKDERSGG